MSFVYDSLKTLTDGGIGWSGAKDITATLVSDAAPLDPAQTEIPAAAALLTIPVPDRTYDKAIATHGALHFQGVPAGTNVAGIVFARGKTPFVFVSGATTTSPSNVTNITYGAGEAFRL